MRLIDHRVRRGALLAEVHDRLWPEVGLHLVHERRVAEIAHIRLDLFAADLRPHRNALLQRGDRDEAVDPQLIVVAAAREVVAYGHLVTGGAQVQRGRPPKVSVTAKNQDLHAGAPVPFFGSGVSPALSACESTRQSAKSNESKTGGARG